MTSTVRLAPVILPLARDASRPLDGAYRLVDDTQLSEHQICRVLHQLMTSNRHVDDIVYQDGVFYLRVTSTDAWTTGYKPPVPALEALIREQLAPDLTAA